MHTFTYTRENLHPQLWRGHEIVLSIEFNKLQFWWSECLSKKRELKKSVSVILEWDLFDKKLVMTNVIHLSTRHWWRYLNLKEKLYQLFRMRSKTSHTTKNSVLYDDYFLHIMLVFDRRRRWYRWMLLHLQQRFLIHLRMGLIQRRLHHVTSLKITFIQRRFFRQNRLKTSYILRWYARQNRLRIRLIRRRFMRYNHLCMRTILRKFGQKSSYNVYYFYFFTLHLLYHIHTLNLTCR